MQQASIGWLLRYLFPIFLVFDYRGLACLDASSRRAVYRFDF
jgi:hypothetical protein